MVAPFDQSIVTFTSPPVVEVVAGVGFEESDPTLGPVMASFWQSELRPQYPKFEQQAPYIPPREQFESESAPRPPQFQIEHGLSSPFPRMWVSSPDQQELIQLHPRYFGCNWRRVKRGATYDNWRSRRSRFAEIYEQLIGYCERAAIAVPKVNQCEVTYVNHIFSGATWHSHAEWWRVFEVKFGSSTPYPVERLSAEAQFLVIRESGSKARLHCKVFPAFDSESEAPIYVLELTVRGTPDGPGVPEVLSFMDEAREAIDETFLSVTTRTVQENWGIQR